MLMDKSTRVLYAGCRATCHPHAIVATKERPAMTHPSPLDLARTAQNMARGAPADNALVFNKVAMVCMGVMAAASVLQVLRPMLRELAHNSRSPTPPNDARCR